MSDFISVNGQLFPHEAARISPSDAGFLHGAGLFETMRARNRKVFRMGNHLARLTQSAAALAIPIHLAETELAELIAELLEANDLTDARVRLTLTRGDLHEATGETPQPPVTLVMSAAQFTPYSADLYAQGMTVSICPYKQNPESPLTGHKTTSYFDRLAGLAVAHRLGMGESLWFTAHDHILAEGCVSNVFMVGVGGAILTPPLQAFERPGQLLCLAGITRKVVMEVGESLGIAISEARLSVEDVLTAREIFLTNAIMGVMPVTRIERHGVGDEKPGPLTMRLRESYERKLREECG